MCASALLPASLRRRRDWNGSRHRGGRLNVPDEAHTAHGIELADLRRIGHFAYESGHHGDTWLDLDPLFVDQRRLSWIAGEVAERLRKRGAEVICSPLIGGALLGQWVAHHLELPFVYAVRIAPSGEAPVRYRIPDGIADILAGRRVAIVDDAINAGSATLATRDEIAWLAGIPIVAGAIFVRDPGGIDLLAAEGLTVEALVGVPFSIWTPADCPLCASGLRLAVVGSS